MTNSSAVQAVSRERNVEIYLRRLRMRTGGGTLKLRTQPSSHDSLGSEAGAHYSYVLPLSRTSSHH